MYELLSRKHLRGALWKSASEFAFEFEELFKFKTKKSVASTVEPLVDEALKGMKTRPNKDEAGKIFEDAEAEAREAIKSTVNEEVFRETVTEARSKFESEPNKLLDEVAACTKTTIIRRAETILMSEAGKALRAVEYLAQGVFSEVLKPRKDDRCPETVLVLPTGLGNSVIGVDDIHIQISEGNVRSYVPVDEKDTADDSPSLGSGLTPEDWMKYHVYIPTNALAHQQQLIQGLREELIQERNKGIKRRTVAIFRGHLCAALKKHIVSLYGSGCSDCS